jgi:Putative beta-barrel porin-2, OmpL-like. bbp2
MREAAIRALIRHVLCAGAWGVTLAVVGNGWVKAQDEPFAVPTPGDRPAFEKADSVVGEEPGEQPPWSLTNLWDYDERRSLSEAGRNPLVERNWRVSASTVQSFVVNPSSPKDHFNGPVTWTDRANEYQLNQQWIYVERTTDTSRGDFDLGCRIDFLYGTNYRWTTSAGLEDLWNINVAESFYGLSMPQAYVETAWRDVKVKWGHFISPIGYFTVDTTQNFFFTLPYTYQYGEAFTHWGALATWTVNDQLVVGSGVTRGWDNFNGAGSGSHGVGWLGTAAYTFESKASIAYVGMASNEFNNQLNPRPNYSTRYLQSLVYSTPVVDKLNYVIQTDFATQGNTFDFSGARQIGTSRWYGINQYLFYIQNEKLAWGLNFEWFRDQGGYRVGTLLPTLTYPTSKARGLASDRYGYVGNFYQLTFGPKWTPTKSLFIRPNVRFDWFDGIASNPGSLQPFGNGNRKNQVLIGADVGLLY